jgi:hypothetical protein
MEKTSYKEELVPSSGYAAIEVLFGDGIKRCFQMYRDGTVAAVHGPMDIYSGNEVATMGNNCNGEYSIATDAKVWPSRRRW